MKYDAKCRPWEACSRDATRPALMDAHLAGDTLVATDGHLMVMLKVELDDGDTDGAVTVEAMRAAAKASVRNRLGLDGTIDVLGDAGLVRYPRPDHDYPDHRAVLPAYKRGDPGTVTFGVDVDLLRRVVAALGCDGKLVLTLRRGRDGSVDSAILVEPLNSDAGTAIVMPLRADR